MSPDQHSINLAVEALAMTQCPAYHAEGVCRSGCYSEPACQADEPTEGWIPYAIKLLTEAEADGREHRLVKTVELAIECLEALVHPDPQRGILTNVKQQGEAQGVPLTETYDAVVDLIAVLREEIA